MLCTKKTSATSHKYLGVVHRSELILQTYYVYTFISKIRFSYSPIQKPGLFESLNFSISISHPLKQGSLPWRDVTAPWPVSESFMFSLWCIDWVGSLYANRIFMCFVLRVASGPSVKLASCKSALNPPVVYSTDRSKAVVPVLILLFLALLFILRGDLLYVFPCVILFLCFSVLSVLLVLRLPRLGKRELILVLFVRLFDLCLFGFVGFLFLLGVAFCDCCTPWTFLVPFFRHNLKL